MLKLLVNADDFGLSEKTNEGIEYAHRNGILTSASLMANGAAFEHAVAICRQVPSLDVGIHLTLVEERPLLAALAVPSLVDAKGRFPRHATVFTKQYFLGRLSLTEIRAELEAQIRKVLKHGIHISHLDSHQHVHMLPQILKIAVSLAKEYDIPFIRFPGEKLCSYMVQGPGAISRVLQLLGLRFFCALGDRSPLSRTDRFAGFFFGGKMTRKNLREVIEHLPQDGVYELMCHPGLADPLSNYSHWGYDPSGECAALVDQETRSLLNLRGIQLVNFMDLAAAGSTPRASG